MSESETAAARSSNVSSTRCVNILSFGNLARSENENYAAHSGSYSKIMVDAFEENLGTRNPITGAASAFVSV
ncbi:hypothetical protein MPLA_760015 [Mesorhizobium sp. ORS 3359]|nr:hypothetical protein MPLA_760015 [Mesorhizobium sp. ORS 3359]